jgi:hypothetical protein
VVTPDDLFVAAEREVEESAVGPAVHRFSRTGAAMNWQDRIAALRAEAAAKLESPAAQYFIGKRLELRRQWRATHTKA